MNVGSPVHNGNISVKNMSVDVENELAVSTSVEKESISAEMLTVDNEISIPSQSYEIENESNISLFDLIIEDPSASMMKYIQHQEINYPAASTLLTLDEPQEQNIPDEVLVGSWVSVGFVNKWIRALWKK